MKLTHKDKVALRDARHAQFKHALTLSPDQAKNWAAVESAMKEISKARYLGRQKIAEGFKKKKAAGGKLDLAARLKLRAKILRSAAERTEKFAAAAAPLIASLDADQTRRMAFLLSAASRKRAAKRKFGKLASYVHSVAASKVSK